ncbi:unnamed protein product, partial [Brassica rapa subsp. trilocularis]
CLLKQLGLLNPKSYTPENHQMSVFGEALEIIFAEKKEFESIPTDTIWLLEVAGDLENSHDTRRLKNKNRSHEGLF